MLPTVLDSLLEGATRVSGYERRSTLGNLSHVGSYTQFRVGTTLIAPNGKRWKVTAVVDGKVYAQREGDKVAQPIDKSIGWRTEKHAMARLPDPTPGVADSPGENAHTIARNLHYSKFDPPRARGAAPKVSSAELNRMHVRIVGLMARLQSARQKGQSHAADSIARALRRELSAYTVGRGTLTDEVERARSLVRRPKRIREESLFDSLMERAA